jgi:hypothetical protein
MQDTSQAWTLLISNRTVRKYLCFNNPSKAYNLSIIFIRLSDQRYGNFTCIQSCWKSEKEKERENFCEIFRMKSKSGEKAVCMLNFPLFLSVSFSRCTMYQANSACCMLTLYTGMQNYCTVKRLLLISIIWVYYERPKTHKAESQKDETGRWTFNRDRDDWQRKN